MYARVCYRSFVRGLVGLSVRETPSADGGRRAVRVAELQWQILSRQSVRRLAAASETNVLWSGRGRPGGAPCSDFRSYQTEMISALAAP